jgi:hypothetical protein
MFREGEALMPVYPEINDVTISESGRKPDAKPATGKALLQALRELGLIGLWADRDDIGETVEYARKLREAASKRVNDVGA